MRSVYLILITLFIFNKNVIGQLNPFSKVCVIEKERKYGVIDNTGKLVIPCIYDAIEPSCDSLLVAKKNGKFGFINFKGKIIISFDYEFAQPFNEGLAAVRKKGKYGFVNIKNKSVINYLYENVNDFREGFAGVKINNKWGFIDKINNWKIQPTYDSVYSFINDHAIVVRGEHKGLIDKNGSVTIPVIMNELQSSGNYYKVSKIEKEAFGNVKIREGLVDANNKTILPMNYLYIEIKLDFINELFPCLINNNTNDQFYIVKNIDGSKGLINIKNHQVTCCYMDLIPMGNGYYIFKQVDTTSYYGFLYGLIDSTGKVILNPIYDSIGELSEDKIAVEKNGKYGYLNLKNETVIEFKYDQATKFYNNRALVVVGNELCLIDQHGNYLLRNLPYDKDILKFNSKFGKHLISISKKGKFGAIDYNGKEVVSPIYDTEISFWDFN